MSPNQTFDTAVDFVNKTGCHIFLTGKAGTGKTTFLRYIKEHTHKKCVVVAPTGVAAINAGGVTMHSFFHLPLGPYVPVNKRSGTDGVTDRHALFKNMRFSEEKRTMLRELELLIIDEVSMVRCDTLDAIDAILRFVRRRPDRLFGGVQVLFIGDLFQLPPVMPDGDWSMLSEYYASPFFFHSNVVEQCSLVYIELKKIYRQSEEQFVTILNNIRNNEATERDLEILNSKFQAQRIEGKNYITLTSHNYKADKINQQELTKLPGKSYQFTGTIEGDFPEKTLPTDITLLLKEGAQVMFIRNDKSEDRKYFNGKIGTISRIDAEGVRIIFSESEEELLLERETWDNIRYSYDRSEEKINEEKLGSFSQYPIRLAWAITIHKSQGLTFEHAIIDAGESFAPGQVYVALSRCTSLDGLILHSRIAPKSISTNSVVIAFSRKEKDGEALSSMLTKEKTAYLNRALLDAFDFQELIESLENHAERVQGKKPLNVKDAAAFAGKILRDVGDLQKVALKFQAQLVTLIDENDEDKLKERVKKAMEYFTGSISDAVLQPLDAHIDSLKGQRKVRKYLKHIREIRSITDRKIYAIANARYGDQEFSSSVQATTSVAKPAVKEKKKEKGSSLQETLSLFRSGLAIPEIASRRDLTTGTVESHFAQLVKSGDVKIQEIITEEKLRSILDAITELQGVGLTPIKQRLGDTASYGEIRSVLNHLEFMQVKDAGSQ